MKNISLIILILVVIAGGYILYTQQQTITKLSTKIDQTSPSTSLPSTVDSNQKVVPTVESQQIIPTQHEVPTPTTLQKAVVVFQAEGSIPNLDKSQLQARIINPILDYYEETTDDSPIVSLTIEPNTNANKTEYPYLGTIIFANGGNNGFVITKKEGAIAWWVPECMICVFSDAYKAKYPEVVSQFP